MFQTVHHNVETLDGFGLHTGAASSVQFRVYDGVSCVQHVTADQCLRVPLSNCVLRGGNRGTDLLLPNGTVIRTVEHVFSAVTGLGCFDGVEITFTGPEAPLLDGGSASFVAGLVKLGVAKTARRVRAVRDADWSGDDGALYTIRVHTECLVQAIVSFPVERFGVKLAGTACFDGDAEKYVTNISPARTFGALRELDELRRRGLARHVPVGSVIALDSQDSEWKPRHESEPIQHKLLDLLGDIACLGANLQGKLTAFKPSHQASIQAITAWKLAGIFVEVE